MAFDLSTAKPAEAGATGGFDLKTAQPVKATQKDRKWSDVPGEAISNIPSSAANFAGSIYEMVRHPLDTGATLVDAAAGGLNKLLPESLAKAIDYNPEATKRAEGVADGVGGFFKDRYGSVEGLKKTIATDPVGLAADAATLLSGGAAAATRTGMTGTGAALRAGAKAINPISVVTTAASKAAPVIGEAAANLIGGLGTHTGAESIKEAYKAGKRGGKPASDLADNMRGKANMTDVLDDARANVLELGRQKSLEYSRGMANVVGDNTVLDFKGIDGIVTQAAKDVRFKGQIKNEAAAKVQQQIADEINAWKRLPPDQYHTPAGLDALKQKVGDIVDAIPFEQKSTLRVGTQMYNAIKGEIVKQAPTYADTMKGYSEATEQIREVERALSLGKKAATDTALRKLQSVMRNNANTNYGYRVGLTRELEAQGGRELMPALAGQALSSWTPRGIGGAVAGGLGGGAFLAGGPAAAAATLAVQSPRLMGEAALATGKVARAVDRVNVDPNGVNAAFQAGRIGEEGTIQQDATMSPQESQSEPQQAVQVSERAPSMSDGASDDLMIYDPATRQMVPASRR